MTPTTFEALPLAAPLQRALRELEYTVPSPIQAQAIPLLLEGRDLLGCAQTGTGKTAGFALPILHALHEKPRALKPKSARTLVLAPTRELAVQVAKSFTTYGKHVRFRQTLIYGGVGQNPQVSAMRPGVDILVATPGRLLDLIEQRHVDLSGVEFFVLDEVDRMLDMGFLRDVKKIVAMIPQQRQSLFFSATLAPNIVQLAEAILKNPAKVSIEPQTTTAERIVQTVAFVQKEHKRHLLEVLLKEQAGAGEAKLTIVFSRTKHGANKLAKGLTEAGFHADAIHGNKSQAQREKALDRFRKGLTPVLVATDVAARGVDVKDVGLVVNYDLPNEPEAYVHRIGRTGRAGADGRSVSFCSEDEFDYLREIEKVIRMAVPRWNDHHWHAESLVERYQRGVRGSVPHGGSSGGGQRQSQGRSSQGKGRSQGGGRSQGEGYAATGSGSGGRRRAVGGRR
ncbi:DEAD/DEAH box helicase [Luteolibacter arcticus]|uniref:DEAD/DEAH box helicase n=1 Tax=Luteolibacter arcticus TaxID=1581411 RepID=A0ABT3GC49_9BACT|nr:DEAD/DEAH box helicase [Luteolibacter arcticus]MCW1921139.1 DEAD/DEAH box helicase [Luteolibacter arcticus]